MRRSDIKRILRKKYRAYCDQVVAHIKGLSPDCLVSGEDSGLEDVWEEFKFQVQREQSVMFDAYVQTVESFCSTVLKGLADHELELLWLDSERCSGRDDAGRPDSGEVMDGVLQELYQRVLNRADNEKLKFDPDAARQLADHEDDIAPYLPKGG